MRKLRFTIILSLFASFIIIDANAANLSLTPTFLKLKVFKLSVSTSGLCTNLTTVVDNGVTPTEVDFVGTPNLGSGTVSNGTYPCVVIEISDNIKFGSTTGSSTAGNCVQNTEYTLDVCRGGSGLTSALADGTTTTCTNGVNRVAMYLSTGASSSNGSDAFNAPTSIGDAAHGFNLANALTIAGTASAKFVVNPTGKMCDDAAAGCDGGAGGGTSCKMEPPTFNFTPQ